MCDTREFSNPEEFLADRACGKAIRKLFAQLVKAVHDEPDLPIDADDLGSLERQRATLVYFAAFLMDAFGDDVGFIEADAEDADEDASFEPDDDDEDDSCEYSYTDDTEEE